MAVWADFETNDGADGAEVRFSGRLTLARMGDLPQRLDELGPISLLDLSNITRIDTVGAWIVTRTMHRHDAKVVGASQDAQRLLDALANDTSEYRIHGDRRPAWVRMLEQLGTASVAIWNELLGIIGFFGAMVVALFNQIRARRASDGGLCFIHDGGRDPSARPLRQQDGGGADHAGAALPEHVLATDVAIGEETAMGRQGRDAQ